MFAATKGFCDSLLTHGLPGFDLAVYHQGHCVLRYRNGYRDPENKLPMTGKERLNMYSCSKPITCVVALQLWEKGLFSLDDPLWRYLPEFREMTVQTPQGIQKAKKPILIRHLFEMTSGLSYDVNFPQLQLCRQATGGACPGREVVRYLAGEPLLFEPGSDWRYSFSHDVLAVLVEVLVKEPFQDYVKRALFDPLGMDASTYLLPPEELDTVAPQYSFETGKCLPIRNEILTYKLGSQYASGGAGCVSTLEDYMLFLEALRTGILLKPETVRLMTTNRLTPAQQSVFLKKDTHGYGLGVRCSKGDPRYPDFGWDGAAGSYLAVDTENELSIFFAAHLRFPPFVEANRYIYRLARTELFEPGSLPAVQEEANRALSRIPYPKA